MRFYNFPQSVTFCLFSFVWDFPFFPFSRFSLSVFLTTFFLLALDPSLLFSRVGPRGTNPVPVTLPLVFALNLGQV